MLLRKIFQVPISTPTSALYLETGCIPIRYIMRMKRILFLHHILSRVDDALITRAFWAQVEKPTKGDWCIVVREDLDSIGLSHLTYEDIKSMKEESLKQLVKAKIKEIAFNELLVEKEKNSKLSALKYTCLALQPYLSEKSNLKKEEKRTLFRWRTHMIKVKQNYGVKDALCPICKKEGDTQYHLLTCSELARRSPWNITNVISALRLREVLLEQRKKDTTSVL